MPDHRGVLTSEERDQAAEFINRKSKLPNDACLVCGSEDTRIGETLLSLPVGGRVAVLGVVQPVLPVVCANCGFVRYFHAEPLGLVSGSLVSGAGPEPEEGA